MISGKEPSCLVQRLAALDGGRGGDPRAHPPRRRAAGRSPPPPSRPPPAAGRRAAATRTRHLPTAQRVADLLGRMTLAEKVGQMTQAERADVDADPTLITDVRPRQRAVRRRLGPGRQHARGLGRHGRHASRRRRSTPGSASRCSTASTRCTATATCSGATVFPHNIGLGATRDPALVEKIGHITAEGDPGLRAAVGLRAVRLRGPRRPLGPHLRELRRGPAAGDLDGDRHRRAPGPARPARPTRPGAGHRQALRRRRAHRVRTPARATTPIDQGITEVSRAEFDRLALSPYRPGDAASTTSAR